MALQLSRPDPASPDDVAGASFVVSRKGFDQQEVRDFLRMVAAELARLHERERALEQQLREGERTAFAIAAADEEVISRLVGDEASRILQSARDAAARVKAHTEDAVERLLREAGDEARRIREEAEVDAAKRRSESAAVIEAELEAARQQGRDMVEEAREYREKVLADVARRRETARRQIEQIVEGRARLIQAFERSRAAADEALAELGVLGDSDEVDLSPITGQVPVAPSAPIIAGVAALDLAVPHDPSSSDPSSSDPSSSDRVAYDLLPSDLVSEPGEPPRVFDHSDDPDLADVEDSFPDSDPDLADAHADADADADLADADADLADDSGPEFDADLDPDVAQAGDLDADDRPPAPVVGLFSRVAVEAPAEAAAEVSTEAPPAEEPVAEEALDEASTGESPTGESATEAIARPSVDDLFAKLRAARTSVVAERAAEPTIESVATAAAPESVPASAAPVEVPDATTDAALSDTPFTRRDEVLAPLVATAARKLKRVLADEQNEVLSTLRGKQPVHALADLVGDDVAHHGRYLDAIGDELSAAAVAGAMSMGANAAAARKAVKRSSAVQRAGIVLIDDVLLSLRERLDRCVTTADGDREELASLLRPVYREWKNQRIDEHLDDVMRVAFGHGALSGVAPGTPICWSIDPDGPECADAEDNTLGGVVGAGDGFPTEHTCAPAHAGCRCMIVLADS